MIHYKLLKEAIEDSKNERRTRLATCACGHCSSSKYEPLTEEEIDKLISELEKDSEEKN